MKKWFGILLALTLPLAGAVAQENEVVALPAVAPLTVVEVADGVDYTAAPLKEYYEADDGGWEGENYQAPHMTAEEAGRAGELLADYQNGKRPKQTVLDKLENVVVGVYTLNPEDYGGETLFTLLPVDPLTDEQILEVIDAFAQSGRTFDPGALSYQNCMRGGGIETTRFFQMDENSRRDILKDMYVRQGLTSERAFTPLVSDDGLGWVTLNTEAYCGMDSFMFLPYRPMTDDELLGYVIYTQSGDPAEYGNYAAYEKQLRLALKNLLGAPILMTLENEGMGVMGQFNVAYGDEAVYSATFITPDDVRYFGYFDVDTNKLLSASLHRPNTFQYSDLYLNPFDKQWLTVAKDAVTQLRADGMAISAAESYGEIHVQYAGYGALIDVIMEDGSHYELAIPYQSGAVGNCIDYQTSTLDPDQLYAMLYE